MAEIITGDKTKGIKRVGELALRISRFDSYRLFTLYENSTEKKLMSLTGEQKYYLVFKSQNKEIRIPEYDPKGFFEVDKVNGNILFKITKKNAEDILSMKTNGEKIFYIVRVYEDKDAYGRVLSVTDEVEVYHGKWGDDDAFTTFTTENTVDLLEKSLADINKRNSELLKQIQSMTEDYNALSEKKKKLEESVKSLEERNTSLTNQINDLTGNNVYDATVLSTDVSLIGLNDTLSKLDITSEEMAKAVSQIVSSSYDLTESYYNFDDDELDSNINLYVSVGEYEGLEIYIYKNNLYLGSSTMGNDFKLLEENVRNGDKFKFKCEVETPTGGSKQMGLLYEKDGTNGFDTAVSINPSKLIDIRDESANMLFAKMDLNRYDGDYAGEIYASGNIGTLRCYIDTKKPEEYTEQEDATKKEEN
jgi:hypothetical protein